MEPISLAAGLELAPLLKQAEDERSTAPAIADFTLAELTEALRGHGVPTYRARQLFQGIHGRVARDWDELTVLPAALRRDLAAEYRLPALTVRAEQHSTDGTVKLLLAAPDGQTIETVHIPAQVTTESGRTATRLTVCVSSQAGCALACKFCATGEMGFARDLTAGEIVEQIYRAETPGAPRRVDNVVFMGMG
ncbi:MAG: rRNA (adenine2503-C2)-methyltransferase, partial [Chloroflexota bacterium]|nr:rRNA (adenine2503-C2)-methyltransferase [Chloroflexota bacterium]